MAVMVHAIRFNHSSVLYVPKRIIPNHERADVLEVKVCREGSDDTPKDRSHLLYALHNPAYRRALLSLFKLRPKPGERFVIQFVRKYGLNEFVDDYNGLKPMWLGNTRLLCTSTGLAVRVGELEVPLRFNLSAYQGEAYLEASFPDSLGARFRITKSVSSFRVTLKREREPITSIDSDAGRLLIHYRNSHRPEQDHVRVIDIEPGDVVELKEPSSEGQEKQAPDTVRLVSGPLREFEGNYALTCSDEFERYVRSKLLSVRNLSEYVRRKGEIAEAMINRVLSSAGCPELINHPTSKATGGRASDLKGPDSLRVVPPTGSLAYFEFKWWKNTSKALWDSRTQAQMYRASLPLYNGSPVREAYVAVLIWESGRSNMQLVVKRVN